jgi:hypothetical protein
MDDGALADHDGKEGISLWIIAEGHRLSVLAFIL